MKAVKKYFYCLIIISLVTTACKKDIPEPLDPNGNDSISNIISHYFTLSNPEGRLPNGDSIRWETKRWRDTVNIFLDSTVGPAHKAVLSEMIELVERNIQGSGVKFLFVNDTNDLSIGIVNGSQEYLYKRFNLGEPPEVPDSWWGACNKSSYCTSISKSFIWYESGSDDILRHEFGHALGLGHASGYPSLMWRNVGSFLSTNELSKIDLSVLRLIYYDGALGTVAPEYLDSCTEDNLFMYPSEEDNFKIFLEDIIRNNYQ